MRAEDVVELLKARPFEPFRIHLSDGAQFDISHPDQAIVTRSAVHVPVPDPEVVGLAEKVIRCAIIHITRLEPIDGRRAAKKPRRPRRPGSS